MLHNYIPWSVGAYEVDALVLPVCIKQKAHGDKNLRSCPCRAYNLVQKTEYKNESSVSVNIK